MFALSCFRHGRQLWTTVLLLTWLAGCQAFAASLFGPPTFVPLSPSNSDPEAILLGDINGDGNLDMVVGSPSGINVFLGNGDGSFQPPTAYSAEFEPSAFALGDFNGDGKLDVVVVNRCVSGGCLRGGSVQVFLGVGDGMLQLPVSTGTSAFLGSPIGIAVADFNGDGKLDLAVTFIDGGLIGSTDSGLMFLGKGDGTFGEVLPFLGNARVDDPDGLVAGDFNGDGKMDLAVIASRWGNVDVLLGNGDGTFLPKSAFHTGHGRALTAADINGDGHLDLAVTTANVVRLAYGNGDGTFQAVVGLTTDPGADPKTVAAGDFNGDGRQDFAVALGVEEMFVVYINKANGRFEKQFFAAPGGPIGLAVGDLNNDGALDIAVMNAENNNVGIFLNTSGKATATRSLKK